MIYVALAALLWGLGGALAGRFMEAIPPSVLIPLRFLLSFLLLLPLVLRFPPSARERPRLLWVGLALSGAQAFYYLAIHATTVATGIFLQYLAPALLTLYALVRGEKLPLRALLGVALALLGAYVLVVGPGSLVGGPLGVAYGLLSAVSFALYAALSYGLKTPPLVSLGVATGVGSLLSLPVLLLHLPQVLALDLARWGAVAYLVVLGTVVPFGFFLLGVRTFPARQATLVAMLEPVAGAVFAWPLAGEPLSPSALLGGALILAGVHLNRR
ncbi:EamA family transporter [Thermus caliditerrae]|uniref:EamA family transporter n=1 Tax=Thermus caliditerrae TaxID=1330700 RepID=UPI00057118F6|nr:DMT family transporter [Thermus caliditerrae]